jgi:hypothetical protein
MVEMTAKAILDLVLFFLGGLVKNTPNDVDDEVLGYIQAAYANIRKANQAPISKSRLESWEVKVPW